LKLHMIEGVEFQICFARVMSAYSKDGKMCINGDTSFAFSDEV